MDPQSLPRNQEITQVVSLMKTTRDWQNIIPFLAGLRMAGRVLKPNRWEWLIRKAGAADALGIVLECAKQSERTGLRFNNVDVVQKFYFMLHQKAQAAEFRGQGLAKALSLAKQAAMLMEAPEHVVHDVQQDPKRRPFVVGVLLELSAAQALNEFGGNDEGGHVRTYAQRLLATWPRGSFDAEAKDWPRVDRMLQENVPIYNGMKLALQVNGIASQKAISSGLKARVSELERLIREQKKSAPAEVKEQPTLGFRQTQLLMSN
ncbi:hypothetical protein VTN02DRAFT_5841 [Thermoascus thermophilus]